MPLINSLLKSTLVLGPKLNGCLICIGITYVYTYNRINIKKPVNDTTAFKNKSKKVKLFRNAKYVRKGRDV
jgi:hypothetical protein